MTPPSMPPLGVSGARLRDVSVSSARGSLGAQLLREAEAHGLGGLGALLHVDRAKGGERFDESVNDLLGRRGAGGDPDGGGAGEPGDVDIGLVVHEIGPRALA